VAAIPAAEAPAHPPAPYTLGNKSVHGSYHRWLHRARVPLVRGRITIIRRGCPHRPRFAGCVFTNRPRRLYLRPGARSPRHVYYHELGHVFDLRVMRNKHRRAFKRVMHLGHRRWWGGVSPPAELFAEAYAACAHYGRVRRERVGLSAYTYRPTLHQHRAACRLIARAAPKPGHNPPPQPAPKPPPVITEPSRAAPPPPTSSKPPGDPDEHSGPLDWLLPPFRP
jgi:hypothetical protein